jgi:WD40 repeat protein
MNRDTMNANATSFLLALTVCCHAASSGAELTLRLAEDDSNTNSDVVRHAACSPDGATLAAAYGRFIGLLQEPRAGQAVLWDLRTGKQRAALLGHGDGVSWVAFSPDGTLLATGGFDAAVKLWDPATGRERGDLGPGKAPVSSLAFAPDGRTLAVARWGAENDKSGVVQLWELPDRKLIATLTGHTEAIWTVSFSADGATLATGSQDGTARLWDLKTRRQQKVLVSDPKTVTAVCFSPKGDLVATACTAPDPAKPDAVGALRLWTRGTGNDWTEQFLRHGPRGQRVSLAFSPDGKFLASTGESVDIWEMERRTRVATVAADRLATFSADGKSLIVGRDDNVLAVLPVAQFIVGTETPRAETPDRPRDKRAQNEETP